MKKFISLALCLALVFGTAALGVTAYAEDAAPATATEPATKTEPEIEPNPGIATQVKSVEFPKGFFVRCRLAFLFNQTGKNNGNHPSDITLVLTDGTKITVENKNYPEDEGSELTTDFAGEFKLNGEETVHTVSAYYTVLSETEKINYVVFVDEAEIYREEVTEVDNFFFADCYSLLVYISIQIVNNNASFSDLSKIITDSFKSFSSYRKLVAANKYRIL